MLNEFHFTLTLKETTTMHLRHTKYNYKVPHTPYPRKSQIKRLNNSFPTPTAHHHRRHREKQSVVNLKHVTDFIKED